MISANKLLQDFSHLFYPHTCAGCGSDLLEDKQTVCLQCYSLLPETGFFTHSGNPIEKIFYGRLDIAEAAAGYYFTKNSVLQRLIHQLKYNGNQEVGRQLGRWLGTLLLNSGRFTTIDGLIPLPLFPHKEKKRGYNQATVLCEGISEIIQVPLVTDLVLRKRYTDTQTKKGRGDRWKNVDGSFEMNETVPFQYKHLLLVDDVITTGATIEACGYTMKETEQTKLSIVTLAWASND